MKPKWYERLANALFNALFVFVLLGMPWIAAIVIGSGLTWFNFVVLHHRLWLSLVYGFWLPLLLLGFNFLFYRDSPNTRNEMGCLFGITWLILFLILWPVFLKAHQKSVKAHHKPGTQTHGQLNRPSKSQSPGPEQRAA